MGALRDSSVPIPPTIHYTLPRFILKDTGLQLLGNPQIGCPGYNDKSKDQLRAHERLVTPPQDLLLQISLGQRF